MAIDYIGFSSTNIFERSKLWQYITNSDYNAEISLNIQDHSLCS